MSGVTGIQAKGESEFVWHTHCGIGTRVFSPSENVLIPTLMSFSLLLDDYSIMERWSHGIVYYHTHTHTHMHTHIQIAPRTQGDLATRLVQIRRLNLSFPYLDGLVCFDLLNLNMTQMLFATELNIFNWIVWTWHFICISKTLWKQKSGWKCKVQSFSFSFQPLISSLFFFSLYLS